MGIQYIVCVKRKQTQDIVYENVSVQEKVQTIAKRFYGFEKI